MPRVNSHNIKTSFPKRDTAHGFYNVTHFLVKCTAEEITNYPILRTRAEGRSCSRYQLLPKSTPLQRTATKGTWHLDLTLIPHYSCQALRIPCADGCKLPSWACMDCFPNLSPQRGIKTQLLMGCRHS